MGDLPWKLAGQLEPLGKDRQFPEVKQLITAVDGTVVKILSRARQTRQAGGPARPGPAATA